LKINFVTQFVNSQKVTQCEDVEFRCAFLKRQTLHSDLPNNVTIKNLCYAQPKLNENSLVTYNIVEISIYVLRVLNDNL